MADTHDASALTRPTRDNVRSRILSSAIELLFKEGRDALTTRAVAAAAGLQAPTIYRLFGDKRGLLDALAEYGFNDYLSQKELRAPSTDPVEDLRFGWDLHVDFGLSNPALFALMYGDPRPGLLHPAAVKSFSFLKEKIHNIAVAGRLRLNEEMSANLVHASGCGTVFTLVAIPESQRDLSLSIVARESAINAITLDTAASKYSGKCAPAIALRSVLSEISNLTEAERHLMEEWLDRISSMST